MSREAFGVCFQLLLSACWASGCYRSYRGWSDTPRFDAWVYGVLLVLSLMLVGVNLERWSTK